MKRKGLQKKIKIRFKTNIWGNTYAYHGSRRIKFISSWWDAGCWAGYARGKGHLVESVQEPSFARGIEFALENP